VPLSLPKFVLSQLQWVTNFGSGGTRAADLKFLHRLPRGTFRNFKSTALGQAPLIRDGGHPPSS